MAVPNVNDRSFWEDFFKLDGGYGSPTDYRAILITNYPMSTADIDMGVIDPLEIIKFLRIKVTNAFESYLTNRELQIVKLQRRLREYQAKKSEELKALEGRDDAAGISRSANRWANIDRGELSRIINKISATLQPYREDAARVGGEMTDSLILGAALMVAGNERAELLRLVTDPETKVATITDSTTPLEDIATQVVIEIALAGNGTKRVMQRYELMRRYYSYTTGINFTDLMSEIEDFIVDNLMNTPGTPDKLYIAGAGHLLFTRNHGLYFFRYGIRYSISENETIDVNDYPFPIGTLYTSLVKEMGISPFRGGHVIPRHLRRSEDDILSACCKFHIDAKKWNSSQITSFGVFIPTSPIPDDKVFPRIFCSKVGFSMGELDKPYKGPTITIVTKEGDVYTIKEGQIGRIYLSSDDTVQIGDDKPIRLPYLYYEPSPRSSRIEIPPTRETSENHMHHNASSGKMEAKPESLAEFITAPTKIKTPNRRPAKKYNRTQPTPPEALPVRSHSLTSLLTSLWLMFSPTADLKTVVEDAATLPQHSIEVSADSETREGNSHPSNDRRVSERPAALARKSRAQQIARSKAARSLITRV